MPTKETAQTQETAKVVNQPKAGTIMHLMLAQLRLETVPENAEIMKVVKTQFPDSKFDAKHLAWYKNAFKKGKLTGQTGPEKFNQPVVYVLRG